jgi:hypothetical protein
MNNDTVRTLSGSWRRHAAALISFLSVALTLAAPACNSSKDVASGLELEQQCKQNSDCARGLLCALGSCRAMCSSAADCMAGGACIATETIAVCQYPDEKNKPCNKESDCPSPLACASDYRCRNLCASNDDCNVLGIVNRVCAKDANGVEYCADPPEVSGGQIVAPPPPGAPDTGVMEPDIDATASGGDATTSDGGGRDSTVETGDDGGPTTGDAGPDAPADGPATCDEPCPYGTTCSAGQCVQCGSKGQPCCTAGAQCAANLSCAKSGVCDCGHPNEACCSGTSCNSSSVSCLVPDGGTHPICACGLAGTTCCPGEDGGAPTCGGTDNVCAGIKCSCLTKIVGGGYCYNCEGVTAGTYNATVGAQRTDGSLVSDFLPNYSFGPVTWPQGTGTLTDFAFSGASNYAATAIGCGVLGGDVWCYPVGGSVSNSVYLGAGLGPTTTTSTTVQVVTSVGVSPTLLTGISQIAGGTGSASFCALASGGAVWCWGANTGGMLGNGGTADTGYAKQVMANASTPFTGVAEVTVGVQSTCARKTDGTVWCWGSNASGELGTGSTTPANSVYPVQVSLLGTATGLIRRPIRTQCAIMQGGSVACWGSNGYGQAGASPTSVPAPPTAILLTTGGDAGGPALQGVVSVAPDYGGQTICANSTTSGLVCWGDAVQSPGGSRTASPYAVVVYDPGTSAPVVGIASALTADSNGDLLYLNPYGLIVGGAGATPYANQPSCN